MSISIQGITSNYAEEIASLHIRGISTGFISSLGENFVTSLYEAIAKDENSFGVVAVEDDKVLGFVSFSTSLSGLYKHLILTKGFSFAFILARRMFSFRVFKKVIDNILYPSKMKKAGLPSAELLSIVIDPKAQGKGIATQLVEKGLQECKSRSIDEVKVLVSADNRPANKLYKKLGFEFHSHIDSHGVKSNIYVAVLD